MARIKAGASVVALLVAGLGAAAPTGVAEAQSATDLARKIGQTNSGEPARMLLESDQVVYDNDRNTVTALGNVQIYYNGYTLQARKVTFFRTNKRVLAEGDATLTEPTGNIAHAQTIDVTESLSDGFISALTIDSTERSRFTADKAERREGNVTVFTNGAYSACQTCVLDPNKPPFWQIKAAKIIHNQQEKMIYYEDAKLEFLGVPIAYVPYFSHPDPTVKRKTGVLTPNFIVSSELGVGVQIPYYWAPAADWDMTFAPTLLSRQGLLADLEFRKRTDTGLWSIRGVGISQNDPNAFVNTSGDRTWRGAIMTKGEFDINEHWKWGWDATLTSDRQFLPDYKLTSTSKEEATSTLYLTGIGERNYFDARLYRFQIFEDDYRKPGLPIGIGRFLQDKQPFVFPVIDYNMIHDTPVLGGEFGADFNLTSLARDRTDLGLGRTLYGLSGFYTRFSTDLHWEREIIDPAGQVFRPFASLRGDVFYTDPKYRNAPWVEDGTVGRVMPTAGIEYRYPWLLTGALGNHMLEPILQVIASTNEMSAGRLPNEDAQSLVFDATNLFEPNRFSGFDRTEGGTRANVGLRYTFLAEGGGSLSVLAGQSYHLAGVNSFANPAFARLVLKDPRPLTGYGWGLDTSSSDYVAAVNLDTARGLRFGSSVRLDEKDLTLNRAEMQVTGLTGPLAASVTYAYLKTPEILFRLLDQKERKLLEPERSEIQGSMNMRMADTWRLFGGVRYDIRNDFVSGNSLGLGYDNDSFSASLAYTRDTSYLTERDAKKNPALGTSVDQVLYLRFGLRTLGDGSVANSLAR